MVMLVRYVFRHTLKSLALLCRSDPEILNSSESSHSAITPLIFTAVFIPAFPPSSGMALNWLIQVVRKRKGSRAARQNRIYSESQPRSNNPVPPNKDSTIAAQQANIRFQIVVLTH